MDGKIQISSANIAHLEQIQFILNHAIEHTTANYDYEKKEFDFMLNWFNNKVINNLPLLVAVQNNQVLGFVTYDQFRLKFGYRFTMEHSVYVHPNFQQNGVGTTLLKEIITIAKENKIHSLVAGIDAYNAHSIQMHTKLGFKNVGLITQAAYKFNTFLDLQFLQLML